MELSFNAGVASTYLAASSYTIVGDRAIDLSVLPAGRRTITFVATLQSTLSTPTAYVELWDITHGVMITGAQLNNSAASNKTVPNTYVSAALNEGTTNGTIRTDVVSEYEVRLYRSGGNSGDYVVCTNAYIRVVYA